ncbi:hypothetical protein PG5_55970 [Pseudomonas sp. G5(2012)]|nr:hypothetical protein PG5_55970 [Pseudomonas sp. G5(2012)]
MQALLGLPLIRDVINLIYVFFMLQLKFYSECSQFSASQEFDSLSSN